MITWDNFYLFATVSICLWLTGAISALRSSGQSKIAVVLTVAGITCLGIFIAGLWISLQRPPLRTMGETRLWYSFYGDCRAVDVYSLEISMDTFFLYSAVHCFCYHQFAEARDT